MHFAQKRSTTWIGYEVHVTETCDEERPHLIVNVETTPAPMVDRDTLQQVHGQLAAKDLLPGPHLVDAGYVDSEHLVASIRDYGVALIGPTPKDQPWQARTPGAFTLQDFRLDWDREIATCPAGHPSQSWTVNPRAEGDAGPLLPQALPSVRSQAPLHPLGPTSAHVAPARGACGP